MLVGTHLRISSFVYRFIISKYISLSPIDKIFFKSGNILPDFSFSLSRIDHSVVGGTKAYRHHIKKVRDINLSNSKRILSLGVMCHFICDFFCVYHAKESYKKQSILRHLFYELKLHFVLLSMLVSPDKLKDTLLSDQNEKYGFGQNSSFLMGKTGNSNVLANILSTMQLEYHNQKPAIKTDIIYALRATLLSTRILMEEFTVKKQAVMVLVPAIPTASLYNKVS